MLYVYSISDQTVAVEGPVQFTTVGLSKYKTTVQTTETTLTINCPGIYQIAFNGTASTAGTVQLYLNGAEVAGATSTGTSLGFQALVQINPNCCAITSNVPARIQVLNTGAAALDLTNTALTIIRVG